MKLPKRPDTHIIEADSWRLLQSLAPENWIVREISERDYGIDAYIEVSAENGQITGDMFLAQLKGTAEISWASQGSEKPKKARSPQVKTATAGYWLGLPVPVFLFVADLTVENIYWCNTKSHIRNNFEKLSRNESLSFPLTEIADLSSQQGRGLHRIVYVIEKDQPNFSFHVTSLISNARRFADFVCENINRDIFLEVEGDRHLEFRSLYLTCQSVSFHLQQDWDISSLKEIYEQDRLEWRDEFVWLHEKSLDSVLTQLASKYTRLVSDAIDMVSRRQGAYWKHVDPILHALVSSDELTWTLKSIEQDMENIV